MILKQPQKQTNGKQTGLGCFPATPIRTWDKSDWQERRFILAHSSRCSYQGEAPAAGTWGWFHGTSSLDTESNCPGRFSVAVIKCPGAKQLQGEKELILVAVPLQSIAVGKSVQKLDESGHIQNREQREWHVLTYSSACFLYYYTIQNPIPRNAAPTFSLGLYPATSIIMIISRRHAHGHARRHARRHAYPNMVWTIPCLLSSWQLKITIPATDAHFLLFL